MKNKRGFTITEVIVSIAVILIVSVSALTIVTTSVSTSAKNDRRYRAEVAAMNEYEKVRYANYDMDVYNSLKANEQSYYSSVYSDLAETYDSDDFVVSVNIVSVADVEIAVVEPISSSTIFSIPIVTYTSSEESSVSESITSVSEEIIGEKYEVEANY